MKKGRQRLNVAFPLFIPISGIDGNENGYKQEGCKGLDQPTDLTCLLFCQIPFRRIVIHGLCLCKGFALRLVEVSYLSGLSETSEIQMIWACSMFPLILYVSIGKLIKGEITVDEMGYFIVSAYSFPIIEKLLTNDGLIIVPIIGSSLVSKFVMIGK